MTNEKNRPDGDTSKRPVETEAADQAAFIPDNDYTTRPDRQQGLIWNILPAGVKNAISRAALAERLGTDERTVRARVHIEREAGYPIISSTETPGYYRPDTRAELERFAQSMQHRAAETFKIAEAAHAALNELDGQGSFF